MRHNGLDSLGSLQKSPVPLEHHLPSLQLPFSIFSFPSGSVVKNPPAKQEMWVQFLGQEDPLEKRMATHSSILAWETHGQRSLVGYHPWCPRVRHDSATKQQEQLSHSFLLQPTGPYVICNLLPPTPHLLLSPLLAAPHWPLYCPLNTLSLLPPPMQWFCFLCLDSSSPRFTHGSLLASHR